MLAELTRPANRPASLPPCHAPSSTAVTAQYIQHNEEMNFAIAGNVVGAFHFPRALAFALVCVWGGSSDVHRAPLTLVVPLPRPALSCTAIPNVDPCPFCCILGNWFFLGGLGRHLPAMIRNERMALAKVPPSSPPIAARTAARTRSRFHFSADMTPLVRSFGLYVRSTHD